MRIHVLGIGGTFMAALACIARELGHEVEGSDAGLYPPMSKVLAEAGIPVREGYRAEHLDPAPDRVVVGNAMTRGNPAVEHMLDEGLDYESGPSWLARHALRGRHVIAVAGTHGKTTVSSLVAWIPRKRGAEAPAGSSAGRPPSSGRRAGSARARTSSSRPTSTTPPSSTSARSSSTTGPAPSSSTTSSTTTRTSSTTSRAIERQFHHLVRTVPASGCIVSGGPEVERVLAMECWTKVVRLGYGEGGGGLSARAFEPDGSRFEVRADDAGRERRIDVEWKLAGAHNLHNALAALAAARAAGVDLADGARALGGVRRSRAAARGRRRRGRG